ncbi:MAG: hypothetical protein RIR00_906 [Pseudomonadota bacterium]
MRTCCPNCSTIFRVTPEQLRVRSGKVRCGNCQSVFDALAALVDETPDTPTPAETPLSEAELLEQIASGNAPPRIRPAAPASAAPSPAAATAWKKPDSASSSATQREEPRLEPRFNIEAPPPAGDGITDAAREAGLVAARDLTEAPGYSRWSAAPLSPLSGLDAPEDTRPVWPFALATGLLVLALALQLAVHFRSELSRAVPALRSAFTAAGLEIPLPTHAEEISIESTDLQSDSARSLLILQASLRNKSAHAQAWPALELTLTDTHEAVVARRVLRPEDYLPAGAPARFEGGSDINTRLWIDAKELAAVGYRLYVFYP